MAYTFFDESDVSIVTIKKYLQTQYPTFKFTFDSRNDIQYLVMEKSLLEKVHIQIKNQTLYFYNIDTPKIKKYQNIYYLLGYFPGKIFKEKKNTYYYRFRDKVVKNMLKDVPKTKYDSNNGSLFIDCLYDRKAIEVKE